MDTIEPNASSVFPLLPVLRLGKLWGMEIGKRPLPPEIGFLKRGRVNGAVDGGMTRGGRSWFLRTQAEELIEGSGLDVL